MESGAEEGEAMSNEGVGEEKPVLRGTAEYYSDPRYFEEKGFRGDYHDFDTTRDFYRQYAEMIGTAFGLAGKRILDVGCAKGISVSEYLRRGGDAYGTDISFYLEQASPVDVRARVWQGDMGRPFDDWMARKPSSAPAECDLVTCVETLEHVMPWRVPLAITNLARACGAWLYLTIPCGTEWDHNMEHICIRPEVWWRQRFGALNGCLRRSEVMEEGIRAVVLSDGMQPFKVWPWLPFIYEKVGPVTDLAVHLALREYRRGEVLYERGEAEYDGREVAK